SDSAAVRSATPSKKTTGCWLYQRSSVRVRVVPCHGDDSGTCRWNVAPGTNRRAGSSVYSSILIAPLRPCALVSRPTRNRVLSGAVRLGIGVHHVDADPATVGEGGDEGSQGGGRAATAANDAAEVLGVHAHLEELATVGVAFRH